MSKNERNFWIKVSVCFILIISLCIWGAFEDAKSKSKRHKAFMTECSKQDPEYKCKVLWVQLNNGNYF